MRSRSSLLIHLQVLQLISTLPMLASSLHVGLYLVCRAGSLQRVLSMGCGNGVVAIQFFTGFNDSHVLGAS